MIIHLFISFLFISHYIGSYKETQSTIESQKLYNLHRTTDKTRSSATAETALVGGLYAVQGHSRSLMLGPIESPYATSY